MNNWKIKVSLSILAGLLVSLCFEPFGVSFIAFVAYVPLLFVLENERSFWRILLYAWTAMFVQSLISFEWIHLVAHEFGGLSWILCTLVLLAFALLTTFSIQIFAVLYYLARRYFKKEHGYIFYLLLVPMLFCLAEALDPKIFKWFLGDSLTSYKYMVQFADFFGVSGLSFLIMVFNASVFLIIKKRYILPVSLCVAIPLFLFLYGKQSYSSLKDMQERCPLIRAGVVQANIGNPIQLSVAQAMKFKSEFGYKADSPYVNDMTLILKKYKKMTLSLIEENKDVDLIVWPETAFPGYYIDTNEAAVEHKKMVAALELPFLIGAYYLDKEENYYNSAIVILPNGQVSLYHKTMLLPFGEYMPLGNLFPFLKNVVPAVSDFSRGAGPEVLKLVVQGMEVRFAPTICYEILNSGYVGRMVSKDAHVLLNMSNDSWFGTVAPYQHLRITRMRAVEYRRPILRSTNTGISTLVDITGEVIKKSTHNKEENIIMDVPICDHRIRSFYSIVGKYFIYLTVIASIFIVLWSRKGRRK